MPAAAQAFNEQYKRYLRYILTGTEHVPLEQVTVVTTLINVSLLAALLVPAFVVEYALVQMWRLVVPLCVAGVVMVATPLIYRFSRSMFVARELFIVALFSFKLWECVIFGDVVSPGAVWFIAMPLIAIMLGSVRSAVAWLVITNLAIILAHLVLGNNVVFPIASTENPHFLYIFSHIGASFSIAIFLLIVESARRHAFQRLKIANETISNLAIRDALTGVYNRRHIVSEINRAEDAADSFSICLLDLDHFKRINDTHGHAVGDLVLQRVARAVQDEIRQSDCFGRYGGEEFLLLLKDANLAGSKQLLERIRERIETLEIAEMQNCSRITISGGVAQYRPGESGSETINRADQALYAAKAAGRNRIIFEDVCQ